MLDILSELASEIQVPEEHILEGRVSTGIVYTEGGSWSCFSLLLNQDWRGFHQY